LALVTAGLLALGAALGLLAAVLALAVVVFAVAVFVVVEVVFFTAGLVVVAAFLVVGLVVAMIAPFPEVKFAERVGRARFSALQAGNATPVA
jgi:hypothetical protein